MLFSGCCAVSVEPAVWVWKRSIMRLGILGAEVVAHDARPHAAGGAELRHFFQEIAVRVEEERQPGRELVHVETGVNGGLHVGHAVGQGEGDLLHRGRAGLAHVVAGDGDGVPLGHVLRWRRRRCR